MLGTTLGLLLGTALGLELGIMLGNILGTVLGKVLGTLVGTLVGGSEVCLNPLISQVRDFGSMSAFKNAIPLQVTSLLLA